MHGFGWLLLVAVVLVLAGLWMWFRATRLDRLHARLDAAEAALDAQLVRRAAAVAQLVEPGVSAMLTVDERHEYEQLARTALYSASGVIDRIEVENALGRAVARLVPAAESAGAPAAEELRESATRVLVARRFYNDAVRDTRALRSRRLSRLLHLAGRRALPEFFDIDDTVPPRLMPAAPHVPSTDQDRS